MQTTPGFNWRARSALDCGSLLPLSAMAACCQQRAHLRTKLLSRRPAVAGLYQPGPEAMSARSDTALEPAGNVLLTKMILPGFDWRARSALDCGDLSPLCGGADLSARGHGGPNMAKSFAQKSITFVHPQSRRQASTAQSGNKFPHSKEASPPVSTTHLFVLHPRLIP